MNQLQTINNISGKPEYVLLPINVYKILRRDIIQAFKTIDQEYEDFDPKDFIKNPITLLRMRAKITQTELAKRLKVTQAYISKIENDNYNVTSEVLKKIKKVLKTK
ncbi:MAG: helix-turn-helix transcriptional regulator [Gammaproteobacteria bacterium]|jgi:DNA-binding XRE family transcriptional regulator